MARSFWTRQRTPTASGGRVLPRRRVCSYFMDIFRLEEESGLWERGEELHRERSYEPQELVEYLTQAGFQDIRQFGNLKMRAPKPGEDRIFFTARKNPKLTTQI